MVINETTTKNDIFYIGINMVRMIILKRRMHHGIAVNAAIDDLSRHLKSPPPPQLITPLPLVDTKMGTPRRRWEKGSTPIKTHPPITMHDTPIQTPTNASIKSTSPSDLLLSSLPLIDTMVVPSPPLRSSLLASTPTV
jgi:hypothetical protein